MMDLTKTETPFGVLQEKSPEVAAALVAELVEAGDRMRDLIAPIAHEFPSLVAAMNSWGAVLAKLEGKAND